MVRVRTEIHCLKCCTVQRRQIKLSIRFLLRTMIGEWVEKVSNFWGGFFGQ